MEGDSQEVYDDVAAVDPDDVGAGDGEAGKLTTYHMGRGREEVGVRVRGMAESYLAVE